MDNNHQAASPAPLNVSPVEDEKVDELIAFAILRARKTCNRIDAAQATPEELYTHVARLLPLNNETQQDTAG
jgi:hypothetical protein